MSDADTSSNAPFDFDRLLTLVELMEKHGLTEISLQRGDEKWRLRRGIETSAPPITYSQQAPLAPSRIGSSRQRGSCPELRPHRRTTAQSQSIAPPLARFIPRRRPTTLRLFPSVRPFCRKPWCASSKR